MSRYAMIVITFNRQHGTVGEIFQLQPHKLHLAQFKARSNQNLYSLSGKTSYRQTSWSLKAARLDVSATTGCCSHMVPVHRSLQ